MLSSMVLKSKMTVKSDSVYTVLVTFTHAMNTLLSLQRIFAKTVTVIKGPSFVAGPGSSFTTLFAKTDIIIRL